jgi:integrase
MVFRRGKSKVYHYRFMYKDKPYQRSTKQKDKDTAIKLESAELTRLTRVDAGLEVPVSAISKRKYRTIDSLLDALEADYKLRALLSRQTASHFKRVRADFGKFEARDLTSEDVDDYISKRLAVKKGPKGEDIPGDAPATINRVTQLLTQAFNFALERNHLVRVPKIRRLSEKGNERKGFLRPAQFEKVLAHVPADLQDFVEWGYKTGQRKGETAGMTWNMLDGSVLRLPGDIVKNRDPRTMPLTAALMTIIERRKAARRIEENGTVRMAEFIFHRGDGQQVACFKKAWKTACKKAGVPATLYHDLRRSFVKNGTDAGIRASLLMRAGGWQTESMLKRYQIDIDPEVLAAMEATENYLTAERIKAQAEQNVVQMEASR